MNLKPCPFCGGEANTIKLENNLPFLSGYCVSCFGCNARTEKCKTEATAAEAWNRRTGELEPPTDCCCNLETYSLETLLKDGKEQK